MNNARFLICFRYEWAAPARRPPTPSQATNTLLTCAFIRSVPIEDRATGPRAGDCPHITKVTTETEKITVAGGGVGPGTDEGRDPSALGLAHPDGARRGGVEVQGDPGPHVGHEHPVLVPGVDLGRDA